MDLKNYKMKFTDTGVKASFKNPQYSLNYKAENKATGSDMSYNIISALLGDNDVLIEVNTSIMLNMGRKTKISTEDFLRNIRKLNIKYSIRSFTSTNSKGVLYMLFGKGKEEESQEILAYFPNDMWKDLELYNIIPDSGIRYYIIDGNSDSNTVLDDISRLNNEEKLDYFKMIVFDIACCNQMGISSKKLTADQIKKMLGIN